MADVYLGLNGSRILWNNAKTKFGVSLSYGAYNGLSHCIMLKNSNGDVLSWFDANTFLQDSVLENVEYNQDSKTLIFTWTTNGETNTTSIDLSNLIDVYAAGEELTLDDNVFSHSKVFEGGYTGVEGQNGIFTIPVLTVNEYGHITSVVDQSIDINLPSELPNPEALTINVNDTTISYDGSGSESINITIPSELPNPESLTIKIGNSQSVYDGSNAQTVSVDFMTNEEIDSMIASIGLVEPVIESITITE